MSAHSRRRLAVAATAAAAGLIAASLTDIPADADPATQPDVNSAFSQFADRLSGKVAVAAAAPGDTDPVVLSTLPDDQTPAWGTIRVPLALAATRSAEPATVAPSVTAAVGDGDNAAADALLHALGGQAAGRVQDVLSGLGSPTPVPAADDYAALAGTPWAPADQARFGAQLLCAEDRGAVTAPMIRDRQDSRDGWGIDDLVSEVEFLGSHGGWGPVAAGRYSARQLGLIQTSRGLTAVSVTVLPDQEGVEAATELAGAVAGWLRDALGALPAGSCDEQPTQPAEQPATPEQPTAPAQPAEPEQPTAAAAPADSSPEPAPAGDVPAGETPALEATPAGQSPTPDAASTARPYLPRARTQWVREVERMRDGAAGGDRARLDELLAQPVAEWVGGGELDKIRRLMGRTNEGVPVIVLYNIPDRDLGSHSAGGAGADSDYLNWIKQVSDTIGDRHAVLVLEPDALPHMPELGERGQRRARLLAGALTALGRNTNAAVYLDAGHAHWRSADQTADLLRQVASHGAKIPGISLNVSNFKSTQITERYGRDVATKFGQDLPLLVDTSRNGDPASDHSSEWCNPTQQLLGKVPDTEFDPAADVEYAFVKTPGESDGVCGVSSAQAGHFDAGLLRRQLGQ